MKTLLKGEVSFVENHINWSIDVFVKWNKKRIQIILKSRKKDLKTEFVTCALSDSNFFSFATRSHSYNFTGKKSKYSELILESAAAQSLMKSRNASIKLEEKYLIFNGKIRKNDISSLSNIFTLNEILMEEIDTLNNENT